MDRLLRSGGLVVSGVHWTRRPSFSRTLTIVVIVCFALALAQIIITRTGDLAAAANSGTEFISMLEGQLLVYPAGLAARLFDFVPFFALAALLALLHFAQASSSGVIVPLRPRARLALAILFAGFVVGVEGELYGIVLPASFLVGLVAFRLLLSGGSEVVEKAIAKENGRPSHEVGSIVASHQAELLRRAQAIDALRRGKTALYTDHSNGKLDYASYRERLRRIDEQIERVRSEGSPDFPESGRVRLPKRVWPHGLVLSVGPTGSWWSNGAEAVKAGLVAALVPLVIYLYVLLTKAPTEIWSFFGGVDVARGILHEMAFWLIAAFIFGCAYAHLPGENGVLKALSLTIVYALSSGVNALVQSWTNEAPGLGWIFRAWQLLLVLGLIGVWLDRKTLEGQGFYWRHLFDSYRVRPARAVVVYLAPLLVSLIGIGQQLLSGDAQNAVLEVIKGLPNLIPVG
jgi:hypothetical protein